MISIIIPAYNEEQSLSGTLDCLTKLIIPEGESWEIILVDNASTDRTAELAMSWKDRLPITVIVEKRKGRGAARAAGARKASGDILFFTDADTLVPPHWVVELLEVLKKNHAVAASTDADFFGLSPLNRWIFRIMWNGAIRLQNALFGFTTLAGYSTVVTHAAYDAAGGYDPELNTHEDTDLAHRLNAVGAVVFAPPSFSVKTSGRRMKQGLLRVAYQYWGQFLRWKILGKESVHVDDPR